MRQERSHRIELTNQGESSPEGMVVTAEPVHLMTLQRSVEAVGNLHGFEEISISSKLDGQVERVNHDVGSVVLPGEVLLELDATDAMLALEQAERSLQTELAKWGFKKVPEENEDIDELPLVASARLRYELAKSRRSRLKPLRDSKTITEEEFEQAESDERVSEAEWSNQKLVARHAVANARLKQADLQVAIQRVKDCKIIVPVPKLLDSSSDQSYTISERLVSEGSRLRPGTEVFKMVLGKTLKLKLSVPEASGNGIKVGQAVEVFTTAAVATAAGKVMRVSPTVDPQTRSLLVEVEIPNREGTLKPGGFARGKIILGEAQQAITVPLDALYSFAGINKLFVIEKGVAKEIQVILGDRTGQWVEIASPQLKPDAIVATSGQRLLSEGVAVVIRQKTDGSSAEKSSDQKTMAPNSPAEPVVAKPTSGELEAGS
jgi:membrane fusion protein (multidrug efflux system)